jgi:CO/xanthine dehydrogenase Mo-binding subunit
LDHRVVEDAGVAVNPMVVKGQLRGGIVQGIGAVLKAPSRRRLQLSIRSRMR